MYRVSDRSAGKVPLIWLTLLERGDKLVAEAVAPLWNKAKNGVKISKGMLSDGIQL